MTQLSLKRSGGRGLWVCSSVVGECAALLHGDKQAAGHTQMRACSVHLRPLLLACKAAHELLMSTSMHHICVSLWVWYRQQNGSNS